MNPAAPPTPGTEKIAKKLNKLRLAAMALCGLLFASLSTCSPRMTALEEVQALGMLRVITTNSPTTYFVDADGGAGFEHDLAKGFADSLGVQMEIVLADSPAQALQMLREGRGQLAAAGLSITEQRTKEVRFTQPIRSVVPQLVFAMGHENPKSLADLKGTLRVPEGSAHAELLQQLKAKDLPDLQWEGSAANTEELLYEVATGQLDYTIANSDIVAMHQRYYPKLRVAFTLSESHDIAWALAPGKDSSLLDYAEQYLAELGPKEKERLRDRYFQHSEQMDYVSAMTLAQHVQSRLPGLQDAFMKAAEQYGLDWRLLAAMGYQESHWNPAAISPTGVRGIMMLTMATATAMKVANREDPMQSIFGGAKYFRQLADQIPAEVKEPDRSWMALAAYNMGMGHLIDVRGLTRRTGGDPLRWADVRNNLPLLTQSKWYGQLKFGYARGYETITYVSNVRTYYDMLMWISSGGQGQPAAAEEPPLEIPRIRPEDAEPFDIITSPVL